MSLFHTFRDLLQAQYKHMTSVGSQVILNTEVDRNHIWEVYINSFDEDIRQEYNCNCCKSFIRQAGGAVAIDHDLNTLTLWDLDLDLLPERYHRVVQAMRAYVQSLSIVGPLYPLKGSNQQLYGTVESFDDKRKVIWSHFNIPVGLTKNYNPEKVGSVRETKNVMLRGLEEITPESLDIVAELAAQGTLYRGSVYAAPIAKFKKIQEDYNATPVHNSQAFCWLISLSTHESVARIRNTALGVILLDISSGMSIDDALQRYEKIHAPCNYKRPKAKHTPRMIENAKKKLTELGLVGALNRRLLDSRDVTVNNSLFTYRSDKPKGGDVFDQLQDEVKVSRKSLERVDEIPVNKFIESVLPKAKGIRVLVDLEHQSNFAALTGPVDPEAKDLFQWNNSFGWSYTGGVADSIRQRVVEAGGKVDGWGRFSLSWYNHDDLDIHLYKKNSDSHIFYGSMTHRSMPGARLDVDMNAGGHRSKKPVENIHMQQALPDGEYEIRIHNYTARNREDKGFVVEAEIGGNTQRFHSDKSPSGGKFHDHSIPFTMAGGKISFPNNSFSSDGTGQTKWGILTGCWHKVNNIMYSPNHWDKPQGHKHLFLILEGCVPDEKVRPFYNEFLINDLASERKVCEVLGGKIEVAPTEGAALAGLGFSETLRNSIYVEVEGAYKRIVKVNF